MNEKIKKLFNVVFDKKQKLNKMRPLPKELVNNLYEWFKVEEAYSSNALEGIGFTRLETAFFRKGFNCFGKIFKRTSRNKKTMLMQLILYKK